MNAGDGLHSYYFRNTAVKIESIDVAETIKTTKALIETEASLSLDLKEALDQLLYVTKLMFDRALL